MKLLRLLRRPWLASTLFGLVSSAAGWLFAGSWTTPKLPAAVYSGRDDVQYFPEGPQFRLSNQVRALEEYKKSMQSAGRAARTAIEEQASAFEIER